MPVSEVNALKRAAQRETQKGAGESAHNETRCRRSMLELGDVRRAAIAIASSGKGSFHTQAAEVLSALKESLPSPASQVTSQTVFLRDGADESLFRELLHKHFGQATPVTTFVAEAPCNGAALALEAWAIGGSVKIERLNRHAVALTYDGARWIHCGDIAVPDHPEGVYALSGSVLQRMRGVLADAGSGLENAVRTWFYLGDITGEEGPTQRYKELNRARTDFYKDIRFHGDLLMPDPPQGIYPASTGIGMRGRSLAAQCLTVETDRKDARLLALENPQQTPAYAYHAKYSPQSPKFSRAMALVLGERVTTWVSGTASIVNSESKHDGNAKLQTEQTLENIERLVSAENFRFHGVKHGGTKLEQFSRARVYVKRAADYESVREVCERRFGAVPIIYVVADVCRPELLVEIEGVVFR